MNYAESLIGDTFYEICKYVSPHDLFSIRTVSKEWLKFVDNKKTWENHIKSIIDFSKSILELEKKTWCPIIGSWLLDATRPADTLRILEESLIKLTGKENISFSEFKQAIKFFYEIYNIKVQNEYKAHQTLIFVDITKPILLYFREELGDYVISGITVKKYGDFLFLDGTMYPGYEHIHNTTQFVDIKKYPELKLVERLCFFVREHNFPSPLFQIIDKKNPLSYYKQSYDSKYLRGKSIDNNSELINSAGKGKYLTFAEIS